MSSLSSIDLAMSAIEGHRQLDDSAFSGVNSKFAEIVKIFTRFLGSSWIMVANHEISGHGARAREYKLKNIRYTIRPFDGATTFSNEDFSRLHPHKQGALMVAGLEANYLLSEKIKTKMIESDSVNPVYAISYIWTKLDQTIYIANATNKEKNNDRNDINSYIKGINELYNTNLTISKLRRLGYLDLLDPFLFYSLYSYFFDANANIPMFEISSVQYLPSAKVVFTPYGAETRLINHFKIQDKYYKLSLGYGSNKRFDYYNLTVNANNVLKLNKTSIGCDLAFWSAPKMLTRNPMNATIQKGCMLAVNTKHPVKNNTNLIISVGYKTSGFVEGMPLENSAILRAGLRFNI